MLTQNIDKHTAEIFSQNKTDNKWYPGNNFVDRSVIIHVICE